MEIAKSVVAFCIAVILHGIGHWSAGRVLEGGRPALRLSQTGLRLVQTHPYKSYQSECLISAAGPLCSLIAAFFLRLLTKNTPECILSSVSVYSLYIGMINLFPLSGFDGYRILSCLFAIRMPSYADAEKRMCQISLLTLSVLWFICVYLLINGHGALSLYFFCIHLFWDVMDNTGAS